MQVMRRSMYITSPQVPGTHALLNDTGAQFSAISLRLAKKHHLYISPIVDGEPMNLHLAEKSKIVPRIGSVRIPVTIHFSGGAPRAPYSCRKQFEVLDMHHDFLLGVDILPYLFPYDDVMDHLLLPSRITSPPQPLLLPDRRDHDEQNRTAVNQFTDNMRTTLAYVKSDDDRPPTSTSQATIIDEYVQDRIDEYYGRLFTCDIDEEIKYRMKVQAAATVSAASATSSQPDVLVSTASTMDRSTRAVTSVDTMHVDRRNRIASETTIISAAIDELAAQVIGEMGVGGVPVSEVPDKPTASTPTDMEKEYAPKRARVVEELSPLLKINEALTGFCTGEGSVVSLSVNKEDEQHIHTRQYPMPQALEAPVDECIQRWLQQGRIVLAPHGCKYNSPLLAVRKKDDQGRMTGVRVCLDIRKLNKYLLEDDRFQIPHIPDMLSTLAGGKIFGEFDLSEAYFQFQLAERARAYTAFTWKKQQYMFIGCPYGIKHIPSLFQRFISQLFNDMPFVFTYIDNICFSSRTWDEHLEHAAAIVERLNSVNLRIKPSSVNLGNYQIKLLGHLITPHGIGLDPEKRDIMLQWPKPSTGSELASFLGLGTFLRDHVRYYADITAPFEKMKKVTRIEWTPLLEQQFRCGETCIRNSTLLNIP